MTSAGDAQHSFDLRSAGIRGHVVRLESTWSEILDHADYRADVAAFLGESLVASALFAGALKFEGSLSIHLRNAGALRLLFAECTHDGDVRGIARVDDGPVADAVDLRDPRARLAITIENSRTGTRYQGLVPVESESLSKAFEGYFERSEQLPTHIVLAEREGRCAGIMLQMIAASAEATAPADRDAWNRVGHLLATLSTDELLMLPVETLLLRLFHEEGVVLQPPRPIRFRCSCSRQRVLGMLKALGSEQASAALSGDEPVEITCEFCNRRYHVDRVDLALVFADRPQAPGPASAQ